MLERFLAAYEPIHRLQQEIFSKSKDKPRLINVAPLCISIMEEIIKLKYTEQMKSVIHKSRRRRSAHSKRREKRDGRKHKSGLFHSFLINFSCCCLCSADIK